MATLVMTKPAGAVIVVTGFVPFTSSQPGCVGDVCRRIISIVGEKRVSELARCQPRRREVERGAGRVIGIDVPGRVDVAVDESIEIIRATIDDSPGRVAIARVRRAVVVQHLKLNGLASMKVAGKDVRRAARCVVDMIRRHDGHHPPLL